MSGRSDSERNLRMMKTLRAVGSGDAAPLGLENSLKRMEDLTSSAAEVEVNNAKTGEEQVTIPQEENENLETAVKMESNMMTTSTDVEQRQITSNINTSTEVGAKQIEPENSKTESHEDSGTSSSDSDSDGEDTLGREQCVSAEKMVSESDSFMDRLRKAKVEIDELAIINDKEKLNSGDVQPSKAAAESVQDLEIITLKAPPLRSSTSSEICSENKTLSSRPSEPSSSEYKPLCKVAELNAWVEKGIWMSSSEGDKANDLRRSCSNSEVRQISPVSTMSSGAFLLGNPGTEAAATGIEVPECLTEVAESLTDTEVYLAGPPLEFRDETDKDYEDRMDDLGESSSGSFLSFSQKHLAIPSEGATGEDKTKYTTCATGDTDCSEQFSPRTARSGTSTTDHDGPYSELPRRELKGKVENITFGEEYDGVQVVNEGQQCVEADLLWANAKYWENGQMIVPEEEVENGSGHDEPNSEARDYVVHNRVGKFPRNELSTPRSGRDQGDYEIGDSGDDYTCDQRNSLMPISDEIDKALTNSNGPNSATESTYDHTYLGRTNIFRPTLTAHERKMLGVPSETSSGENEVEVPVKPEYKKSLVKGAMKELLFPNPKVDQTAATTSAPRDENKKSHMYYKVVAALAIGRRAVASYANITNLPALENKNYSLPPYHRRKSRTESRSGTDSEREESPGSSIVRAQEHESDVAHSSESGAEGDHNFNAKSEVPLSPLVRSRRVVPNDDDTEFKKVPLVPPRKYNTLPRRADVSEKQSHSLRFDTTSDANAKLEPQEDNVGRNLAVKLEGFYDSKKSLKKERNMRIEVLKHDADVRKSMVKHTSKAEIQELAENKKNQLDQIKREAKFKAFKAKQEYKLNKTVMKQDKWKGAVRKLIEQRKLEKEMMRFKLESELLNMNEKMKKDEKELLSKAEEKARIAEKKFKKKFSTLSQKMRRSYYMAENEGYVPDDDLLMESMGELCESVLTEEEDRHFVASSVRMHD